MPNPASSGTGYLTIAAWLQAMGEEAGWKFMDGLHRTIDWYYATKNREQVAQTLELALTAR